MWTMAPEQDAALYRQVRMEEAERARIQALAMRGRPTVVQRAARRVGGALERLGRELQARAGGPSLRQRPARAGAGR